MKNIDTVAKRALENWYASYLADHDRRYAKKRKPDILELSVTRAKSIGHELYIFTNHTLDRHIVTELRGYPLAHMVCDTSQYDLSTNKKSYYVVQGATYPADCFTRRELGHSIPKKHWDKVRYLPVVPLENRLAYHDRDHAIYLYYKVARAIIRFSGEVTRTIEGKKWSCAMIADDTYIVIAPEVQRVHDESNESVNDGPRMVNEWNVYLSRDRDDDVERKESVKKNPHRDGFVKLSHKGRVTSRIRKDKIRAIPLSDCVVK